MKFKKLLELVTASTIFVMITASADQITDTTSITTQEDYNESLYLHTNYCIDAYMMFGTKVG